MKRDKTLEWQATSEAYLAMVDELRINIEGYIDDMRKGDNYVAFSREIERYLLELMAEERDVYLLAKTAIMESALEMVESRFKSILGYGG